MPYSNKPTHLKPLQTFLQDVILYSFMPGLHGRIDLSQLTPEQVAQIQTDLQYRALDRLKLPFEQAIQIETDWQYRAIDLLELPFEQAIQIKTCSQYNAIDLLNLTFEPALQIENCEQSMIEFTRDELLGVDM